MILQKLWQHTQSLHNTSQMSLSAKRGSGYKTPSLIQKLSPIDYCSKTKTQFSPVESHWVYKQLLRTDPMPSTTQREPNTIFWRLLISWCFVCALFYFLSFLYSLLCIYYCFHVVFLCEFYVWECVSLHLYLFFVLFLWIFPSQLFASHYSSLLVFILYYLSLIFKMPVYIPE